MRRRTQLGSAALSAGLFMSFSVGCGHAIDASKAKQEAASAGGSSNIVNCDMGLGGSNPMVAVLPKGGAPSTSTSVSSGSGECPAAKMPSEATRPGYTAPRDPEVAALLQSMSSDSKIRQMYGVPNPSAGDAYRDIERSTDVPSGSGKTVRGIKYRDAGHGVNLVAGQNDRQTQGHDYSTVFPVQSARAASWDVALEMQLGEAMGEETMTSKNNMLLAPCMNIIRHPYWGRVQETYGEDMYQVGRMASALTAGIQKHVMACAKHFAANNIENNRANQNAAMDEQTLREIYTRHFEMVVEEGGVACIMAAYNSINGKKCTQNQHLLTDILKAPASKNGYGFRGLVLSDWWAMPGDQAAPDVPTAQAQTLEAVQAGMDVEVPWALHYLQLGALLDAQKITTAPIDEAAGRVLEQKFRFQTAYTDQAFGTCQASTTLSGDSITGNEAHLKLAEEAEIRSSVLLKNGLGGTPVLPIKTVGSIAVVGLDSTITLTDSTEPPTSGPVLHFATDANLGDRGSSRVNADPAKTVGPFDGIKAAAASHGITNVTSGNTLDAAQAADLVVVVVGLTAGDEGEEYSLASHGDRTTLALPNGQEAFVDSVLGLQKPTVIIIESGSIVSLPWLKHSNQQQATIWAGYGGQRAGDAYGKLLFGDRNFSGKMALAWPEEKDLPAFRDPGTTTQMGYFFGYRYYDNLTALGTPVSLVFPFGYGLSYTTYQYSNLQVPCGAVSKTGVVNVTVDVANTGSVDGDEVVMLFVAGPPKPSTIKGARAVKELKRFERVSLKASGAADGSDFVRVTLPLNVQDLRHWEGGADGAWVIDEGSYTIMVGTNADDALKLTGTLTIHG